MRKQNRRMSSRGARFAMLGVLGIALVTPWSASAVGGASACRNTAMRPTGWVAAPALDVTRICAATIRLDSADPMLRYDSGVVQLHPKIYLVLLGSQWRTPPGNPDREPSYLAKFYSGLAGPLDAWSTTLSQYCQGAPDGAATCGPETSHIVHPTTSPLRGAYFDVATPAHHQPGSSDIIDAATAAASHFGNTTDASNVDAQYIVMTPSGHSPEGFGPGGWCAQHAWTQTKYGNLSLTILPYIPDAGPACGARLVGPDESLDGVSIYASLEYAESVTDPIPVGGWIDGAFLEIGDKCDSRLAANTTLATGLFAVHALWSNNDGPDGGCVTNYQSPTRQH